MEAERDRHRQTETEHRLNESKSNAGGLHPVGDVHGIQCLHIRVS